jgi:hypothetical protein
MCGARSGTPSRFLTFSVVACSSRFDRPSQLSRLAKRMHGRARSCSLERKRLQASALSGGKQQAVASKRSMLHVHPCCMSPAPDASSPQHAPAACIARVHPPPHATRHYCAAGSQKVGVSVFVCVCVCVCGVGDRPRLWSCRRARSDAPWPACSDPVKGGIRVIRGIRGIRDIRGIRVIRVIRVIAVTESKLENQATTLNET